MSQKTSSKPIENAEEVIRKFGGIRPMASKLGVPVTTVQGWKKRNTIPGDRVVEVLSGAQALDIDLSDVMRTNMYEKEEPFASISRNTDDTSASASGAPKKQKPEGASKDRIEVISAEDIRLEQSRNTKHYLWAALGGASLIALFGYFTFSAPALDPEVSESSTQTRLQALEAEVTGLNGRVDDLGERTSLLEGLGIEQRLQQVQSKTDQLGQAVGNYGQLFDQFTTQLTSDNPETTAQISALMERVTELSNNLQDGNSVREEIQSLAQLIRENDIEIEQLYKAYTDNAIRTEQKLQQMGGQVSQADLKAATMLIALTQLRRSFDRQTSFEQDLALLRKLGGEEDQELQQAITRLMPYAQKGVLSIGGLQEQFKLLGGDIVSASLRGEDVSLKEKALARLNSIVSVKKDGEAVVATDTQKLVSQAQLELDKGNIQNALSILQQLDGEAAQAAQPFIENAHGTYLANQLESQLGRSLIQKLGAVSSGSPGMAPVFIQPVPAQPRPVMPQTQREQRQSEPITPKAQTETQLEQPATTTRPSEPNLP